MDVSGHRDFIKNAMSGISVADVGILVVAACPGEFESGISKEGRTKEHALIAYAYGISQLIVCINKMDEKWVKYSQKRYEEVKM